MQRGVFEGDRQAKPGAAGDPLAGRVRAPEPVEDPLHGRGGHAHPVVPDRDRNRILVAVHPDDDRFAFTVIDRVAQQIVQDATDATAVDVRLEIAARCHHAKRRTLRLGQGGDALDRVLDEVDEVGRLCLHVDGARVVSAHLQQIGEQRLEPLNLRVQQFRRARCRRRERITLVVEHVTGEPDCRERRAQLVRHVRHETLLHLREGRQSRDLVLQRRRHPVERPGKGGDDVVALDRDAHLELSGRELLAGLCRELHGPDDQPDDDEGDGADQQDQGQPTEDERALHEAEGLLEILDVVDEVQLVARPADVEDGSEHQPRFDSGVRLHEAARTATPCAARSVPAPPP